MVDPRHAAARRVLLNALDALDEHLDAIVVAGAQAVYLQTGDANVGIAEFTTDGDLAIDVGRLAALPLLTDLMDARFAQRRDSRGFVEPGVWVQTIDIEGQDIEVPIDLIVPEGFAPPGGNRGARLGGHGKRTARKVVGLEAALFDYDKLMIRALEPDDSREIQCKVAGPTALLISKAHKIQDRLDRSSRPDRVRDKDAGDVFRLMRTTPAEVVIQVASRLIGDPRTSASSLRGLSLLREQFGSRRAPGVEMAVRSLGLGMPEDRIRGACVKFIGSIG